MKQNAFFSEINGNFGFGCMRLPMQGEEIDKETFCSMIDAFLEAGFNYFDTAHGYHAGKSELAIRDCLSARYDRSRFLLTNKLTEPFFNKQEDIRPFFESQLKNCGVEYFDFYLMHAQDRDNYPKFQECKAYETAFELKKEGLIRHVGLSFHDTPDVLDRILTDHPEVEIVQIQFNYVDYDDPAVRSREVYEVCEKHQKPVIVMEPVKGGTLVNLPEAAAKILRAAGPGSNASYAIRYAASFPQMSMVLSGMSNMEQMQDNIHVMKDFQPLSDKEKNAIREVTDIFNELEMIKCTSCKYCIEENQCPMNIRIPELFSVYNQFGIFKDPGLKFVYNNFKTGNGQGKASECIECGNCEAVCPQHLPIRELLKEVAAEMES